MVLVTLPSVSMTRTWGGASLGVDDHRPGTDCYGPNLVTAMPVPCLLWSLHQGQDVKG